MAITGKWKLPSSGTIPIGKDVGNISNSLSNKAVIVDGQVCRIYTVVVHTFEVFNFDDPILEASEGLLAWEKSEAGIWIMEHAVETPIWHKQENFAKYSVEFRITAKLLEQHYTFWQLKWNSK
jgi:hypothetical protein